jgi:DNA repair protein RecO (recombination protein O)
MLRKDDGIVLSTSRSGDTSLLVTFLGRESGKIRLMAKGALSSRNPSRGTLEPGNHVEVVFYFREDRTLYFVKESSLLRAPAHPRDSLPHMAALLAVLELLSLVCYSGGADPDIVELAVECIGASNAADPLRVFLAFELRLLALLGVDPALDACAACGKALERGVYDARTGEARCPAHGAGLSDGIALTAAVIEEASRWRDEPLGAIAAGGVDPRARKTLGKILHWTYTFHVQGYSLPKSLNLI